MTTAGVPLRQKDAAVSPAVLSRRSRGAAKKLRLRAQKRADRSQDAAEFMRCYDEALRQLEKGKSPPDGYRQWGSVVRQAAEIEALAAYRMQQSYGHPLRCRCPECTQRRVERAAQG